jgi:hypothetical protein
MWRVGLSSCELSEGSPANYLRGSASGLKVELSNRQTCTWLYWPTAQISLRDGAYIKPIELLNDRPAIPLPVAFSHRDSPDENTVGRDVTFILVRTGEEQQVVAL